MAKEGMLVTYVPVVTNAGFVCIFKQNVNIKESPVILSHKRV